MHDRIGENEPVFSFIYGGEAFVQSKGKWKTQHTRDGDGRGGEWRYADPATGLVIVNRYKLMPEFAAVDWLLTLENTGSRETPLIERILPLDILLHPAEAKQELRLHHAKGSHCEQDDFLPYMTPLKAGRTVRFAPLGGRSSDTAFPFFMTEGAAANAVSGAETAAEAAANAASDAATGVGASPRFGGYIAAIGWSGQWKAEFVRREDGVHVSGGMELTRLKLLPGEKIRTPRILLAEWRGENAVDGHNLLRRLILARYTRTRDGQPVLPPLAHMRMSTYHATKITSEALELEALEQAAELGLEAYWVDACWYGKGEDWYREAGSWSINRNFFPNGLKTIGDAAHARGMKLVQWFEPERVFRGTELDLEHPEFLLEWEGDTGSKVFDLGNPTAWRYMLELLTERLRESGADIYRQDSNLALLPFWRANDAPDRQGMTEIRHIEGQYALWDELLLRFPGLAIDNCASGGRRIDLETVSRSFSLWRSDYSDIGALEFGAGVLPIGDQSQTAGLSRWVPLHSASVWSFTPYAFRSAMSTGLCVYCSMTDGTFPMAEARRAFAELRRIRPYLLGDFVPLLPLTVNEHDWCAYQFHRGDLEAGVAVILRRHRSPFEQLRLELRQIDGAAEYEYGLAPSFEEPEMAPIAGNKLQAMSLQLGEAGSSMLLYYRRRP